MRTIPFLLILVLPLSLPDARGADVPGTGEAFVIIETTEESGPELAKAGLQLLAHLPDGYLALLDEENLRILEVRDLPHQVLPGGSDPGREIFILRGLGEDSPLPSSAGVELLHQGSDYGILSRDAEDAERFPLDAYEIQRVPRRPLRFVRRPWSEHRTGRELNHDPKIQAMVDAIEQTDLESQVQILEDFGTRHSEYNGGHQASLWIRDRFLAHGYTELEFHDYNGWNDNVVCVKPGAVTPDEIIVLGGHYDSVSLNPSDAPGADDNATGSVGVLQAARVMAGCDFERTIIFIAFSGEEQGLVGSEAWASEAAGAGMDIVGMINLDMLGYLAGGDTVDLDIISNGVSQPLFDLAAEAIAVYVPDHPVVAGELSSGSSDHASFWANGYRAIFFHEDSEESSPYIHTTDDIVGLSANDFSFMLENVKATVAASAVLARPYHVAISHLPHGHSEDLGPFSLTAMIFSAEPLDPGSLWLNYRVDGGAFSGLPLLPGGQAHEYEAEIPAQEQGAHVEYYLSAADVSGNTKTHPDGAPLILHSFRAGVSYVLSDDMEEDLGWTPGVPEDDATTGHWIRADPVGSNYQPEDDHSPDPGRLCFVTGNAEPGDASGVNDVDGGRTTLLSPLFDLASASWVGLSYWRWYTDEVNPDDDFFVDISNDNGESWRNLEVVADSAYPWERAVFDDLAALIAPMTLSDRMRLRFVAVDEGQGSLVEALIDDLEIVAVAEDANAVEPVPARLARLDIYPNPFNPRAKLHLSLSAGGWTSLRVHDVSGAELARLWDAPLAAGEHLLVWDASHQASGVYFARLSQEGILLSTRKLTLVK